MTIEPIFFLIYILIFVIFPFTIQEWIIRIVEKRNLVSKDSLIRKIARNIINLQVYPFLFAPVVVIAYIWFLPNVYTIYQCDNYKREILIFPKSTIHNKKMTFGNHSYVINMSDNELFTKTYVYGSSHFKEIIDGTINPNSTKEINIQRFNNIFEMPPMKIKTKGSGSRRYYIGCYLY